MRASKADSPRSDVLGWSRQQRKSIDEIHNHLILFETNKCTIVRRREAIPQKQPKPKTPADPTYIEKVVSEIIGEHGGETEEIDMKRKLENSEKLGEKKEEKEQEKDEQEKPPESHLNSEGEDLMSAADLYQLILKIGNACIAS